MPAIEAERADRGRSHANGGDAHDGEQARMTAADAGSHSAIGRTHVEVVCGYLKGLGIAFELIEHEPAMSAGAEGRLAGEPPEKVAKTIVLHDGGAYVIVAVAAADRLDLHKLRELLGAGRTLRFASEREIAEDFPTLEVGAVPPFGPMVPAAEVIDRALAAESPILCPAGDHCHSVRVETDEIVRATAATVADIRED
jgi:Ala-tRNA(Pro) deacylase